MFQGIIAALFLATDEVMAKVLLTKKKFGVKKFNIMHFILMAVFMVPAVPFFFNLQDTFFTPFYIFVYFGMIMLVVAFNILYYRGVEHEPLDVTQPIIQMSPIFTILLAFVFFPGERNMTHLFLAGIAVVAILSLHIKRHHFVFNKYTALLFSAAFLWSLHIIFLKQLLEVANPFTVSFLRSIGAAIFFIPLYKVDKHDVSDHRLAPMLLISAIIMLENLARLWAYDSIGVVRTSLMLSIAPLIAIWGSHLINKDQMHLKNIVVTAVILCCVTISTIL